MPRKKRSTTDAILILDRMIGDDKKTRRGVAECSLHVDVAQLVYDARNAAGWTQKQLADRVGMKQSVISRVEDSDYHRHSLSMLQRIAFELGLEVKVRFRKTQLVLGSLRSPVQRRFDFARAQSTSRRTGRQTARKRALPARKRG